MHEHYENDLAVVGHSPEGFNTPKKVPLPSPERSTTTTIGTSVMRTPQLGKRTEPTGTRDKSRSKIGLTLDTIASRTAPTKKTRSHNAAEQFSSPSPPSQFGSPPSQCNSNKEEGSSDVLDVDDQQWPDGDVSNYVDPKNIDDSGTAHFGWTYCQNGQMNLASSGNGLRRYYYCVGVFQCQSCSFVATRPTPSACLVPSLTISPEQMSILELQIHSWKP